MTETASKKKAASKKRAASVNGKGPGDMERGRPKEIKVGLGTEVTEEGRVILYSRNRLTVMGVTYLESTTRVLRLPPGCFFMVRLDEQWIARGVRLFDNLVADECIVSMLVSSDSTVIVGEGQRIGEMIPMASARLAIKAVDQNG